MLFQSFLKWLTTIITTIIIQRRYNTTTKSALHLHNIVPYTFSINEYHHDGFSTLSISTHSLNTGKQMKAYESLQAFKQYESCIQKIAAEQISEEAFVLMSEYQFLEKYNYTMESHDVVTEDGYILTVHRIPYSRYVSQEQNVRKGTPILLVHCLACSSMDWVWQGPNTSLALLLADSGYDVWLANTRGNAHSLRHKSLTPADSSFWDFSFHEKGYYDIPATIDYILNNTQMDQLTYVGHSQGTSNALVMTSTRLEYNDRLNLMVLLSPIVYVKHSCSPTVLFIGKNIDIAKSILKYFDINGLTYNPYITILTDIFCDEKNPLQSLCVFLIDTFSGFDPDQIDKEKLTVFLTNTPSGLSIRDIEHYTQGIHSGMFRQYDYGSSVRNLIHYQQTDPPSYDISRVKAPVAVYYAKNDFLSRIKDVERLLSELKTDIVDQYLIENEHFNHLDFITAKNVRVLLYDRVIKVINQKNPSTISISPKEV